MPRVEVKSRDVALEAYRIDTDHGGALVPEHLMTRRAGGTGAGLRPGARPSHQEAYEWIAAHRQALCAAVRDLHQGRSPKPPFDVLTLPGGSLTSPGRAPSVSSDSAAPFPAPFPASDRS